MRFILEGETPAKKNSRVTNRKTGRSFPSTRYTEWHDKQMRVLFLLRKNYSVKCACRIKLTFIHGDRRRRDSDNGVSSVFDLLVDAGILPDDCWQVVREFSVDNGYMKNNARCIIEIEEIEE